MSEEVAKCRLKELRNKLGVTQEEFANSIGISKTAISNIDNGKNLMSIEVALAVAEKYPMYLDWFYKRTDNESSGNLDDFLSVFKVGQRSVFIEGKNASYESTFLTVQLSSVTRDYLLKLNEIEKINKEKDLPKDAYNAWRESVKMEYQKALKENKLGEMVEFVLIENDENFGNKVAYVEARCQAGDYAAKAALDELNFGKI